ncbi:MAG: hypothetical protein IJ789_00470 [Bacteroidales bacterium]|nr:hypothetical protein [Bacteroidales bacterium]
MKKNKINLTIFAALLLCLAGCGKKPVVNPASSTEAVESISTSHTSPQVDSAIETMAQEPDIMKLKERYSEAKATIDRVYNAEPKANRIMTDQLKHAYYRRFTQLAYAALSDGSGWRAPKWKVISSLYKEIKSEGSPSTVEWEEIKGAMNDYHSMLNTKNSVQEFCSKQPSFAKASGIEWHSIDDCKLKIKSRPNVGSLAQKAPIYDTLSESNIQNKISEGHTRFLRELVTLCDKNPTEFQKHSEAILSQYEEKTYKNYYYDVYDYHNADTKKEITVTLYSRLEGIKK